MNQAITLPAIFLTIVVSTFFLQKTAPTHAAQQNSVVKTSSLCADDKTHKSDCKEVSGIRISQKETQVYLISD